MKFNEKIRVAIFLDPELQQKVREYAIEIAKPNKRISFNNAYEKLIEAGLKAVEK